MKKYKWFIKDNQTNKAESPILVDEQFNDIIKMEVKYTEISEELKEKLIQHGIYASIRLKDGEIETSYLDLIPTALKQISYSAPLYTRRNGEYYLLSTFFSTKAYAPRDFDAIREEYEKCKKELKNEKT